MKRTGRGAWRARWCAGLAAALLAAALPASAQQSVGRFDEAHTRFGVELLTRWGQRVKGDFPRYDGRIVALDDTRRQVRVRLLASAVRIGDSDRYTQMARGESFFDAAHFPYVEFVSDPIDIRMVETGGPLRGRLTIRDVTRIETFHLLPATCTRPARACDVVAHGQVDRYAYGLDAWRLALDKDVRFTMRVRLAPDEQP
ncbi:YceI family protein [Marilutibacter spongiae]|uniref:YceI family protein n=1 Tax=Marilutibacter spongiae TaxID=2025720 RepID=A0A7W3TPT0_9GAMM|nr:YceI family protein [Lysobacter spongiae]MBB1062034.1 YceI family protein [Lysobacter spongiae]